VNSRSGFYAHRRGLTGPGELKNLEKKIKIKITPPTSEYSSQNPKLTIYSEFAITFPP